jgi:hypothetical protein
MQINLIGGIKMEKIEYIMRVSTKPRGFWGMISATFLRLPKDESFWRAWSWPTTFQTKDKLPFEKGTFVKVTIEEVCVTATLDVT